MKLTKPIYIRHLAQQYARKIHKDIQDMDYDDQEPLDGDQTKAIAKIFLQELNTLNANQ